MLPHQQSHKKGFAGLIFTASLLVVLAGGWLFRQDISDWYRLRQYTAPPEVVALAEQDTMTEEARKIFYTTHPKITGEEEFNANCRQGGASEYSIVLGCYISSGGLYGDMYLYDIDDERLSGVVQVTAGHEMLHAAYDRLSTKERQRVDALLLQAYEDLPDGRIKETIAQYQANDPASVPSELHSILGTEVRDLPAELNEYYSQYFADRLVVVAFSEQYEGEFARREAQVADYDTRLAGLKANIEANQAEIDSRNAELSQKRAQLDSLEASGDAAGFNALVASYNAQVAAYNALVAETRTQIETYNSLVEERNSLALEVQELTEAIDSRPETL